MPPAAARKGVAGLREKPEELHPARHSWLWRVSKLMRSWEQRWFCLDEGGFIYAKSPQGIALAKPVFNVEALVAKATAEPQPQTKDGVPMWGFTVLSDDGGRATLYTDDAALRDTWVRTINLAALARREPQLLPLRFEMEWDKPLGSGLFAVVFRAQSKEGTGPVAIKVIKADAYREYHDLIQREIMVWHAVGHHPHVVRLHEVLYSQHRVYFIAELAAGGNLMEQLASRQRYTEADVARVMRQLLDGVRHLHDKGLVHMDLKPENIVLADRSQDSPIKLIDFSLASFFNTSTEPGGTPEFVAPELLKDPERFADEGCGPAIDIWAVGIILFYLLSGRTPFQAETMEEILELVKRGVWGFTPADTWTTISPEAKDLVSRMLQLDPAKRPSAAQLLAHPWVQPTHSHWPMPLAAAQHEFKVAMGGGNQVHVANRTSWIRRTGVLRPGDGGNVVLPGLSAPAGTHQVLVTGAARGPAHTEGAPAGLTPWPAPAGALVPPSTPLVGQMMIAAPAGAVAQGAWALPSPTTAAIRGNNAPVPAAPINPSTALKQQLEQQLSVLQAVAAAKAASVGSSSAAPSLWASPPASPAVIAGASPILASASSLLTAKSVAKPSALGLDDAQQRDPVSGGAASPARASSRSYGGNGVLLPGDPSATLRSVDSGGASGAGFALQRVDSPVGRPNLASLSGVAPSLLSSSHGNLLLAPMNSGNLFSAAAAAVSGHAQKASSSYDVVVDGIPARTSVGEEGRGFKSSLGPPKGERASGPEWAIRTSVDGDVASPRSLTAAASQSFKRRSQRSSLPDFAGGAADPGFSPSSAAEAQMQQQLFNLQSTAAAPLGSASAAVLPWAGGMSVPQSAGLFAAAAPQQFSVPMMPLAPMMTPQLWMGSQAQPYGAAAGGLLPAGVELVAPGGTQPGMAQMPGPCEGAVRTSASTEAARQQLAALEAQVAALLRKKAEREAAAGVAPTHF